MSTQDLTTLALGIGLHVIVLIALLYMCRERDAKPMCTDLTTEDFTRESEITIVTELQMSESPKTETSVNQSL